MECGDEIVSSLLFVDDMYLVASDVTGINRSVEVFVE